MIDPDTLTDEECLSIEQPWRVHLVPGVPTTWAVFRNGEAEGVPFALAKDAYAEADRRNAAHVRERLRELMGRG